MSTVTKKVKSNDHKTPDSFEYSPSEDSEHEEDNWGIPDKYRKNTTATTNFISVR